MSNDKEGTAREVHDENIVDPAVECAEMHFLITPCFIKMDDPFAECTRLSDNETVKADHKCEKRTDIVPTSTNSYIIKPASLVMEAGSNCDCAKLTLSYQKYRDQIEITLSDDDPDKQVTTIDHPE